MNEVCTDAELGRLNRLFLALGESLEVFAGAPLALGALRAARVDDVVVGRGAVHVAFHLAFHREGGTRRGCLMVPVQDALGLVARHRQLDGEPLEEARQRGVPDDIDKEELLTLGHCLAEALTELDVALTGTTPSVTFVGCQGVRAGMHPHVPRELGEEWIVGRSGARLEPWDEFDLVAMVPPAPGAARDLAEGVDSPEPGDGPSSSEGTEAEGPSPAAA
jgi:hypothetical protein